MKKVVLGLGALVLVLGVGFGYGYKYSNSKYEDYKTEQSDLYKNLEVVILLKEPQINSLQRTLDKWKWELEHNYSPSTVDLYKSDMNDLLIRKEQREELIKIKENWDKNQLTYKQYVTQVLISGKEIEFDSEDLNEYR
jgi:hypothetical protein